MDDRRAAEPLFTLARGSQVDVATDPEPVATGPEPLVRISLLEADPARRAPAPRKAERTGTWRAFARWWRQESLARAAQKRPDRTPDLVDEIAGISRTLGELRDQISELIELHRFQAIETVRSHPTARPLRTDFEP